MPVAARVALALAGVRVDQATQQREAAGDKRQRTTSGALVDEMSDAELNFRRANGYQPFG